MRIVMTTFHAGGNVPPFVELGRELVRRGHSVSCLAQDSLRPTFEEAGVEVRPLMAGQPYEPFERVAVADQLPAFLRVFFDEGYGADLEREMGSASTDAFVIDSYLFGAMAAAEAIGIPTVVLVHTLFGFMDAVAKGSLEPINRVRGRFALAPVSAADIWSPFARIAVATTPALDLGAPSSLSNLRYVGPIFDRRAESGVLPPSADGRPHILVAMSTTFMEQEVPLQNVIDAIAGVAARATVTVGSEVAAGSLRVPDNVTVTGWQRHASLMSAAALVVTHGGHGTVSTALAQGVPLLCIPLGRDQPYISDRVAALGAGIRLPAGSSLTLIRDAVTTLLQDRSYRRRAGEIADAIRTAGEGARNAADEIERLAGPAG